MKSVLMTKSDSRLERKQWVYAMIVVMTLVAGIGLMPRVSEASCFYNMADDKGDITVEFDCGIFCSNTWVLGQGDHKCRPGKGGVANIKRNGLFCDRGLDVQKHGWIEVTHPGSKCRAVSKNEYGQVIDFCEFDWVQ